MSPARLLCPWDSPGKSTGESCHALLQPGIFPTQGSNSGLPQCRRILYHLSHQGMGLVSHYRDGPPVQFSSVTQSCLTLCDPMKRSMPGLPVHHQLPEFTQTHVHRAVMPSSHLILCCSLLLLPSIPPSIRVLSNESSLRMRWPKYWSFSFNIIPSKEIPGLISLQAKGLSRVFSNTTVQKHQFFSAQLSSQSNSHIHT